LRLGISELGVTWACPQATCRRLLCSQGFPPFFSNCPPISRPMSSGGSAPAFVGSFFSTFSRDGQNTRALLPPLGTPSSRPRSRVLLPSSRHRHPFRSHWETGQGSVLPPRTGPSRWRQPERGRRCLF